MTESPRPTRLALRGDEAELFRLHYSRLVRVV